MKWHDLPAWTRFSRLVTTWETERRWKLIYEKCICDCWNTKWIARCSLTNLQIKSCWCWHKEHCRANQARFIKKHSMSHSRMYHIYIAMRSRVNNENHVSYKYYWGKWIRCLWNSFEEFYKDMWESYESHVNKYWEKQTTLDRINRGWNYCKENCRWSTRKEQMYNRDIVDVYWFRYNNIKANDRKKSD